MASTNHTTNLNLNQWLATDPVIREDFNADNAKLDTAVAAKAELSFGTYTGDGAATRTISLDFTPRAVLLFSANGTSNNNEFCYGGLFERDHPLRVNNTAAGTIVSNGFQVVNNGSADIQTNRINTTYYYLLLK